MLRKETHYSCTVDRRSFISGLALLAVGCSSRRDELTVGSKNFTEQLILGELLSQSLQLACSCAVEDRFYLAGSYICHQALLAGRIDTYVEYTGTALAAILKQKYSGDSSQVYQTVKRDYMRQFDLEIMPPLGFNNSFAIIMRGEDARSLRVEKLSQLAPYSPKLKLGVGYEFLERQDGYKGLVHTYDLRFAQAPRVMDLGLLYRALENRAVDVVAGSNTDGLIAALGLVVLEDDKHYFPPYDAVPVVRPQMLERVPQAGAVFETLAGKISADDMRKMNYAVDGLKRDAAQVARAFLVGRGLV